MNIPNEAVIAAAKVLYADKISNHAGDNAPQIIDACEKVARKALEAAAPYLMAQALDEAASVFQERLPDGTGNGRAYNSYRVASTLRDRAEDYRSAGAGE